MKKVCHVTCVHPVEDVRIFHKECCSLEKSGYMVYLVEQGNSYIKNGVHIIGFGDIPANRMKRMLFAARKAYKKALEVDADIYHLHDPELLPYGLKLKRKGKHVIFDSHELYVEQIRTKSYLRFLAPCVAAIYRMLERFILKRIDAVVLPCTFEGKNPFDGVSKYNTIISNAAILDEFFYKFDSLVPKNKNQICYIGALTEIRGITNNIVAANNANASLVLAGTFSPVEYAENLKKLPEYKCVQYRGELNRSEVADLLAESNLGLCTLLNVGQYPKIDTFGIKVYEYMSMALPVILSNSPYNKKMVEKYRFGICVDPADVVQIENAIRYILDHPEEAMEMGENGRKAIFKEFNWGVEEAKLLDLYKLILKE